MGIYAIKPAFRRRLAGASRWCVRHGVSADTLTLAGVVASLAGGAGLAGGVQRRWLLLVVPVLAIGRTALNALDGMVAGEAGTARPFGEVLNELADRVSDAAWFVGLGFAAGMFPALAALVLAYLSSQVGVATKAAGGPRVYAGIMGKADRMVLLSAASLLAVPIGLVVLTWAAWIAAAGAAVTIAQRLAAGLSALRRR
ncbi:MAG: CDP-alcohol phosphatidyltransferase family protein [Actinomycetota bacterium]